MPPVHPLARDQSVFHGGVAQILGRHVCGEPLVWLAEVALATDHQLDSASAGTHGSQLQPIYVALGVRFDLAYRVACWMDGLEIALDLADNLADAEEDAAMGLDWRQFYRRVPPAALPALPMLAVASLVADIFRWPVPAANSSFAADRFLVALSSMVHGQGLSQDDPSYLDLVSGSQGAMVMLPIWAERGPDWLLEPRREPIEAWARSWASTWQSARLAREGKRPAASHDALVSRVRAAWPDFPPFGPTDRLSSARLLP